MTVIVGVNILAMTLLVNDDIFEQIPSLQGMSHWLFTCISAPYSQLLLSLVLVLILQYYINQLDSDSCGSYAAK